MKRETNIDTSLVNRIADAIVDLVERAGGPVTLAQIADQVPNFSAEGSSEISWFWEIEDVVVWDGMTKEGWQSH